MTISPNPEQMQVIDPAIEAGLIHDADEVLEVGLGKSGSGWKSGKFSR